MSAALKRWIAGCAVGPVLLLAGCEGGGEGGGEASGARVEIVSPADGSTVDGAEVRVVLETYGATVEAADNRQTEGRGHHHIYLDTDLTPANEPIPAGVDGIVHMGNAAEEYVFTNLAPGEHRLIARFAYGDHTPIESVAADTVVFTVAP